MIVFVTGTDTGVGKTVGTAALARVYAGRGRSVAALKLAQSGVEPGQPGDMDEVARLAGVPVRELVRLRTPAAPETAARLEGATVPDLCGYRDAVLELGDQHDVVLVEGSGGVLVALAEAITLLDVATMVADAGHEVQFVVVARAGLGTLNHSALTVWAVQERGFWVEGLVVGSWPTSPDVVEEQNLLDLPAYTGVPVLGRIPDGAPCLAPEEFGRQAAGWLPFLG